MHLMSIMINWWRCRHFITFYLKKNVCDKIKIFLNSKSERATEIMSNWEDYLGKVCCQLNARRPTKNTNKQTAHLHFKGFSKSYSSAYVRIRSSVALHTCKYIYARTHARTHCHRIVVIRTMENRKLNADRINVKTHEWEENKQNKIQHNKICEILLLFIARCSVSQLPVDDTASMRKHLDGEPS